MFKNTLTAVTVKCTSYELARDAVTPYLCKCTLAVSQLCNRKFKCGRSELFSRVAKYVSTQLTLTSWRTISSYTHQGPDFDDISSFCPCEIDDAIQYINLGYEAQAPKIVII